MRRVCCVSHAGALLRSLMLREGWSDRYGFDHPTDRGCTHLTSRETVETIRNRPETETEMGGFGGGAETEPKPSSRNRRNHNETAPKPCAKPKAKPRNHPL